jgi:hypothetical protein
MYRIYGTGVPTFALATSSPRQPIDLFDIGNPAAVEIETKVISQMAHDSWNFRDSQSLTLGQEPIYGQCLQQTANSR